MKNFVVRRNVIVDHYPLRGHTVGLWNSRGNLLLDDNLFVDGELGPGISGNYPGPFRNVDVNLVNNVLSDIGRSRPTNRHLAWYLPLADWDGGNIANNLLVRQHHPDIGNAYGIQMSGGNAPLKLLANSEEGFENVRVFENQFQCQVYPNMLAIVESLDGVAFENNTWYTRAINDYFREGFGMERLPLEELPAVQCGPFRPEFSYRDLLGDRE